MLAVGFSSPNTVSNFLNLGICLGVAQSQSIEEKLRQDHLPAKSPRVPDSVQILCISNQVDEGLEALTEQGEQEKERKVKREGVCEQARS